ncbi:MAG: hypothetical protein AABP62_10865 [Planctomycetota bacterium]
MPAQPYYPRPESEQVTWLTNYRGGIGVHGLACGIAAGEITSTEADLDFLIWVMQTWNPAIQRDSKSATAYRTQIATGTSPGGATVPVPVVSTFATPPAVRPPGVLTRLFNQVSRIKLSTGYTETIGQSLRIIGTPVTVEHPFPVFTLTVKQGATSQQVQIDFTKFSHYGVWIESRRNGGEWEFLAIDTVKPYVDDRPLLVAGTAETREYRMRWWDDSEPNGDWSPVQKVTVGT